MSIPKNTILFSLLIITILFLSTQTLGVPRAHIPGEIIVKFKPTIIKMPKGAKIASVGEVEVRPSSIQALNRKYSAYKYEQLFKKILEIRPDMKELENEYIITFPSTIDAEQAAGEYAKDANVTGATPNRTLRAFTTTPNDPYFSQQYALTNMKVAQAWDKTTGANEVLIAVLDTGANYNHEDLQGRVDLSDGYDFVNNDADPMDDHTSAHGTCISGIVAAASNNAKGIAGVDWNAQILPIKVLNAAGEGTIANVLQGIEWARAKHAKVINMSFGQYSADASLQEHCQNAYNDGIVLVASAGNGGVSWPTYPAYYSTVLAVAAVDSDDKRSVWGGIDPVTLNPQSSNYGDWVDVAAPGTNVIATGKDVSQYASVNGTSLSSAYVTGVVALVRSAFPGYTNQQIMDLITSEADNIDSLNPGFEGKIGSGRVNAYAAMAECTLEAPPLPPPPTPVHVPNPTIYPVKTPALLNYQVLSGGRSTDTAYIFVNGSTNEVSYPTLTTWTKRVSLSKGRNSFVVNAQDAAGHSSDPVFTSIEAGDETFSSPSADAFVLIPFGSPTVEIESVNFERVDLPLVPVRGTKFLGTAFKLSCSAEVFSIPLEITLPKPAGGTKLKCYAFDGVNNKWQEVAVKQETASSLIFNSNTLGTYAMFEIIDSQPPVISNIRVDGRRVSELDSISSQPEISLDVSDDYGIASGAMSFAIDGRAAQAGAREAATSGTFTYKEIYPLSLGSHTFSMLVSDEVGNSTAYSIALYVVGNSVSGLMVYPNPYKLGSATPLKFDGLSGDVNIFIYDVAGELVWKGFTAGAASTTWSGVNQAGNAVAAGVYYYVVKDNTGGKTIGQIAVVK